MKIHLNTTVECEGRICGTVTHIIINPVIQAVAYLAVKGQQMPHHEVLVPPGMVGSISPEHIHLHCTEDELNRLPRFIEQDFAKLDMSDNRMTGYLMLPYVLNETLMHPIGHKRIPASELTVRRGACVQATDGEVGRVDAFLCDAANGQITHLVMRPEHVIGLKEVSIPLDVIERMDEHAIYLTIDQQALKNLPYIPIWRSFVPDSYWAHELVKISVASSTQQIEEIAKLIAGLASRSGQKRMQARKTLVGIGKPAIPSLNGLLDNRKHRLRWEAAKSLAQMNDNGCIPGLLKALEDQRFEIRWVAAEGLTALGEPAIKRLLKLLQGRPDSPWLREGAHHIIRSVVGDEPWHEMKSVLLELEKPGTIMASLPGIAKIALESLSSWVNHENGSVRKK